MHHRLGRLQGPHLEVREDEVLEHLRPARGDVLDASVAPEQVKVAADAEVPDEVVQLGDEERRREKARGLVAHAGGLTRAELVVQDDRPAVRLVQVGVRGACTSGVCPGRRLELRGERSGLEVAKDRVRRLEFLRANPKRDGIRGHGSRIQLSVGVCRECPV